MDISSIVKQAELNYLRNLLIHGPHMPYVTSDPLCTWVRMTKTGCVECPLRPECGTISSYINCRETPGQLECEKALRRAITTMENHTETKFRRTPFGRNFTKELDILTDLMQTVENHNPSDKATDLKDRLIDLRLLMGVLA